MCISLVGLLRHNPTKYVSNSIIIDAHETLFGPCQNSLLEMSDGDLYTGVYNLKVMSDFGLSFKFVRILQNCGTLHDFLWHVSHYHPMEVGAS